MTEQLRFKKLHPEAILPRRWSDDAVGWDVHAHLITDTGKRNTLLLPPRTTRNIATGLMIEPPKMHFVMVCSRSGLSSKSIVVANAPGIVDPDYRGELRILLFNGSYESYYIRHQERVAQLFLMPVIPMECIEVTELSESPRGENGFGSTGG